jgi:CBS domain-containing protein
MLKGKPMKQTRTITIPVSANGLLNGKDIYNKQVQPRVMSSDMKLSLGFIAHPMAAAKLTEIKQQLERGVMPPTETVRNFLPWFGVARRGGRAVRRIRRQLEEVGLETDPDFEFAFIDGLIAFVPAGSKEARSDQQETFRIGRLESANRKPVSVKPDTPLCEVVTLMLTHDYSQLPIMTTERNVKGVLSWKTIGSRLALNHQCTCARDCMERPRIVQLEDSLFSAISYISEHDYVLVQAPDRTICGMVTATDSASSSGSWENPFS